jgi:hypothetical protein
MESRQVFLKELETYLDIELSEFDGKRILGYLDEYVGSLPEPEQLPPITIVKNQIVYRYIKETDKRVKNKDIELKVAPKDVISIVSKSAGVTIEDMLSKRRDGDVLLARHVAMYLVRKECDRSWKVTGYLFNRDHTTAIHSYHHVENMVETGNQRYIHLLNQVIPNLPEPIKQSA